MDLSRFHAAFFEESREGLDAMETGLLALESGRGDADTIHTVFRAAHSIKGGAGTFGFHAITELTHLLETLLDQARDGRRAIDAEAGSALLQSVDVLRGLLAAAEHGGAIDSDGLARVQAALSRLLGMPPATTTAAAAAPASASAGWRIAFDPAPSLFMSGNDPLRILRELGGLGDLAATCRDERLPPFTHLDPCEAYLAWDLALPGDVPRAAIDEAFAWVEDQCALRIEATAAPEATIAAAAAATPPGTARSERAEAAAAGESSIRVAVSKVDALINLVGELVITQAMLRQRSTGLDPNQHETLLHGLEQLERNTRDLQEAVMGVRMLPVDFAFSRFPRLVRDLAAKLDKRVRLRTVGEGTELDKGVIEKIVDPLVHLVRNAIDHGLETPDARRAAGKDETGTVTLSAAHQGGHIVIEVGDDGRGLDRERILAKAAERGIALPDNPSDAQVWELIFHPGFSTAAQLTDVSGRGVGMDVVKQNILALGGQVEVRSAAGTGTTVCIRLPLTLAILDGMSVAAGGEVFILPLDAVVESLQPAADDVRTISGSERVLRMRGEVLPLRSMSALYRLPRAEADAETATVVVVESGGQQVALEVDALVGQQQVVVKNLESNYRRVPGISGATILGDGRVALIVDVAAIARGERLAAAA